MSDAQIRGLGRLKADAFKLYIRSPTAWANYLRFVFFFSRLSQSWAGNRLPRLSDQCSTGMGWCSHKQFFLRSVSFRVNGSRQTWAGRREPITPTAIE